MKGLWVWPENEVNQNKTIQGVKNSQHFMTILSKLAKSKDGLSNAQIDQVVKNNSQWNTRWIVSELLGLGLIDYKVDLFGDPGKYSITDLGKDVLKRLITQPQQSKPPSPPATTQ